MSLWCVAKLLIVVSPTMVLVLYDPVSHNLKLRPDFVVHVVYRHVGFVCTERAGHRKIQVWSASIVESVVLSVKRGLYCF